MPQSAARPSPVQRLLRQRSPVSVRQLLIRLCLAGIVIVLLASALQRPGWGPRSSHRCSRPHRHIRAGPDGRRAIARSRRKRRTCDGGGPGAMPPSPPPAPRQPLRRNPAVASPASAWPQSAPLGGRNRGARCAESRGHPRRAGRRGSRSPGRRPGPRVTPRSCMSASSRRSTACRPCSAASPWTSSRACGRAQARRRTSPPSTSARTTCPS